MVLREGALVIFGPRVQVLLELQKVQQAAAAAASQLAVSHV
jgi:hypothetical protein